MRALKFPSLPSIDLTKLDISKFDISKITSNIHVPSINTEPFVKIAKDIAYISVGFGVLTFQKAQVRRRELTSLFEAELPKLANQAVAQAESAVSTVMGFVNTRFGKNEVPTTK